MGAPTLAGTTSPGKGATAIGPGEVHAWLVSLDLSAGQSALVLDAAERERARRYLSRQDGARFAAARAGLRLILAGYLGADPASLRFSTGSRGRPTALAGPTAAPAGLDFSLARTAGLALIAVSTGSVGADVEEVAPRPGLDDLVAARFGEREAACINRGCGGSPVRGFYQHWTAKEAFLKALGCGLAGLRVTELRCDRAEPVIWHRGRPADGWTLSPIPVSTAYAAAVVARQPVTQCWRLAP